MEWGVVFVSCYSISSKFLNNETLDAILAHLQKEEIKAYFA